MNSYTFLTLICLIYLIPASHLISALMQIFLIDKNKCTAQDTMHLNFIKHYKPLIAKEDLIPILLSLQ